MSPKNLRISWPHIILAFVGLATSVYSLEVHRRIKAGDPSGCSINEMFSCDKVLASSYAEVYGIPLGIFGMVFFAIVLMTAFSTEKEFSPQRFRLTQLAIATVGIGTSAVLMYISKVIIGEYCPVCMATHATTTLLFIVSLFAFLKARRT